MKNTNYNGLHILTLPGLFGSGPTHWQTNWEKLFGFERVNQDNWNTPRFERWLCTLVDTLCSDISKKGIVLVAHSLGCHLVIKGLPFISKYISGIFLVAPPDLHKGVIMPDVSSFFTKSVISTDVPGYLVYSENDPFASSQYSRDLGEKLGLQSISVGYKGHINSESNIGDWFEGKEIFDGLITGIVNLTADIQNQFKQYSSAGIHLKSALQSTLKR